MKRSVMIIRIDPFNRKIARIPMAAGKAPTLRDASRIVKAKRVGTRQVMEMDPYPLMVAGRLDVTESMPGWRFLGSEETAGISFLFGRGPGGGMVDVPVDVAWVEKRIVWMTCEFDGGEA